MPAILIECAFCDSPRDMGNYNTDKMANAIFTGMCKAFNVEISAAIYHTVVKGDTLWGLSRAYGVTLNSIVALNGTKVASVISIGEKIRIK